MQSQSIESNSTDHECIQVTKAILVPLYSCNISDHRRLATQIHTSNPKTIGSNPYAQKYHLEFLVTVFSTNNSNERNLLSSEHWIFHRILEESYYYN